MQKIELKAICKVDCLSYLERSPLLASLSFDRWQRIHLLGATVRRYSYSWYYNPVFSYVYTSIGRVGEVDRAGSCGPKRARRNSPSGRRVYFAKFAINIE